MAWVRVGDGSATHPVASRGASVAGADSRTRWELFGFAVALSSVSAYHLTDYIVERGNVELLGGMETDRLIKQLVEAGYLTETTIEGRPAWRLIDDPKFIHLRLREEVEWDRQRKADNGRADLTIEVQRRDGSACRRCGRSVNWNDRTGSRGATYDHLVKPARTADDLTVACRGCNSKRGEPGTDQAANFDNTNPLLPVPSSPYYCDHLRSRLSKHGIEVGTAPDADRPDSPSVDDPPQQRPTVDTAAELPRPSDGHGTVKPGDLAAGVQKSTFPGRVGSGSGQVGSGRAGPGGDGQGAPAPSSRRRRRRGRRSRNPPPPPHPDHYAGNPPPTSGGVP